MLFQAKKDIYQVKSQRLMLAQDEYELLTNALATLNTSRTSCKFNFNKVILTTIKYIAKLKHIFIIE